MQSYWEKVSRDTIIIQGEGFKGYNHYTGRGIKGIQSLYRELRFQGIQSYREKVSRDTIIIQGEGLKEYNYYTGS